MKIRSLRAWGTGLIEQWTCHWLAYGAFDASSEAVRYERPGQFRRRMPTPGSHPHPGRRRCEQNKGDKRASKHEIPPPLRHRGALLRAHGFERAADGSKVRLGSLKFWKGTFFQPWVPGTELPAGRLINFTDLFRFLHKTGHHLAEGHAR